MFKTWSHHSGYAIRKRTLKILEKADEIMAMYQDNVPLATIEDKFNINYTMVHKIRVFKGIKRRGRIRGKRVRQKLRLELTMKEIKIPEHLAKVKSIFKNGIMYKLRAAYSDYLFKSADGKIILIEEKKALNKYTLMSAIVQLELGEKILKEKKNINIDYKILYVKSIRPPPPSNPSNSYVKYTMRDIKKYLNILIIVGS